jgi:hypothetical protein
VRLAFSLLPVSGVKQPRATRSVISQCRSPNPTGVPNREDVEVTLVRGGAVIAT